MWIDTWLDLFDRHLEGFLNQTNVTLLIGDRQIPCQQSEILLTFGSHEMQI